MSTNSRQDIFPLLFINSIGLDPTFSDTKSMSNRNGLSQHKENTLTNRHLIMPILFIVA